MTTGLCTDSYRLSLCARASAALTRLASAFFNAHTHHLMPGLHDLSSA